MKSSFGLIYQFFDSVGANRQPSHVIKLFRMKWGLLYLSEEEFPSFNKARSFGPSLSDLLLLLSVWWRLLTTSGRRLVAFRCDRLNVKG